MKLEIGNGPGCGLPRFRLKQRCQSGAVLGSQSKRLRHEVQEDFPKESEDRGISVRFSEGRKEASVTPPDFDI